MATNGVRRSAGVPHVRLPSGEGQLPNSHSNTEPIQVDIKFKLKVWNVIGE